MGLQTSDQYYAEHEGVERHIDCEKAAQSYEKDSAKPQTSQGVAFVTHDNSRRRRGIHDLSRFSSLLDSEQIS
jgi:hypothetical protein